MLQSRPRALQCSGKVNLKDIFDGDVEQSMTNLHESIQCGVAWKNIFEVRDLLISFNV